MSRLEALIEQAVGVAWASAIPVAGLQAFALRGRHDLIARYRAAVLDSEARGQLRWLDPDPALELDDDATGTVSDKGANLGYVAALRGKQHVDRLIAARDADGLDVEALALGAVLAVPALVDAYADRLPRDEEPLDDAIEPQSLELVVPTVWLSHLAAAVCADDRDAELDRVIDRMLATAAQIAREYVAAVLDESPPDRDDARRSLERLVEQLPPLGDRRARERFVGRMSIRFRRVVAAGERAAIDTVLPQIIAGIGAPETWGYRGFGALCALDRFADAMAVRPDPILCDRVLLLEAYARVGDELRFERELHHIVEDGWVCTSRLGLGALEQLLEARDVMRVARVTSATGRAERLTAALARFT